MFLSILLEIITYTDSDPSPAKDANVNDRNSTHVYVQEITYVTRTVDISRESMAIDDWIKLTSSYLILFSQALPQSIVGSKLDIICGEGHVIHWIRS